MAFADSSSALQKNSVWERRQPRRFSKCLSNEASMDETANVTNTITKLILPRFSRVRDSSNRSMLMN